jgi:MerR family transcriptional regulator/heat shock protein HspR
VFSQKEREKLRLALLLMEEMEVNLPGVEIILRMRQTMDEMRKQFDDILEDLAGILENHLRNAS